MIASTFFMSTHPFVSRDAQRGEPRMSAIDSPHGGSIGGHDHARAERYSAASRITRGALPTLQLNVDIARISGISEADCLKNRQPESREICRQKRLNMAGCATLWDSA
jgi:hypothetical protein